ncbi:hypothetical protein [Nocardioides sp. InS609-2]|uniref:hypothetical protein n=1 Tax=Nocardioides sp. InS609-2 TaxID=2760705 RepID=UPI0020BE2A38|nr:hypothetical protein [Nocardioides sp. InS609-2]
MAGEPLLSAATRAMATGGVHLRGQGFVGISGRLGSLNRSRFFIEEFHEVDLLDPRVRGYHGLTETQLQTAGRSG